MITEYLKAAFDGIKERVKNPFTEKNSTPFAGAFLVALMIFNWQLVYSLFNFDTECTRIDKIVIIEGYLKAIPWWLRILYPLLLAFSSILFYYVFNNISLGITTFFNRWFKATILYIFDRSQIVTREELKENMIKLKNSRMRYEELNNFFAESQSQLESYKNEIHLKDTEITNLNLDTQSLKHDIEVKSKAIEKFEQWKMTPQILFANYGKGENTIDVTENVKDLLQANGKLFANNDNMGIDPIKHIVKELLIVYLVNQEVKTIRAIESSLIFLEDSDLKIQSTPESEKKSNALNNIQKLAEIFTGEWNLKFIKSTTTSVEFVRIEKDGKYYANDRLAFYLINVLIKGNTITFDKLDLVGRIHSTEKLEIQNSELIIGSDTIGYALSYNKAYTY